MSTDCTQPRLLFYVQHLLGIGHLMRSVRVCEALQEIGVEVTLLTGGMPVKGFPPAGIQHIELPPIAVRDGDFSVIVDSNDQEIDDDFKARRCQRLLEVYEELKPDLLVLEAFPFGRRQLRFELLPLLAKIKASNPKPVVVSSVRDVLQKTKKPGRDEYVLNLIDQYFDKILVHGDPQFAQLSDSFDKAHEIEDKVMYSGLVCAKPSDVVAESYDVVVSAGGGAVGTELVRAAVEAASLLPQSLSWCIVTGPNSPINAELDQLRSSSPNIRFETFRTDFPSLLRSAKLSVSQAGYNTVSDILKAACRCLLVPYSSSGETEQLERASRLERLGIAQVLHADSLAGQSLASMVGDSLSRSRPTTDVLLDTDGSRQSAQLLLDLIVKNRS